MSIKNLPTKNRIGNFDSKFGWSRRILPNGKCWYSMWRCLNGKRYLIRYVSMEICRSRVSDELKLCRLILRKVCNHVPKTILMLDSTMADRVEVSRYVKGKTEFESDKIGKKSDSYFEKWLYSLRNLFAKNGISNDEFYNFSNENIARLRRNCENLVSLENIVESYKKCTGTFDENGLNCKGKRNNLIQRSQDRR